MPPHPSSQDAAPASQDTAPGGTGKAAAPFAPWIPIRSLSTRHRDRILAHLTALSEADRYLRFGYVAGDGQMARYVAGLNFERDEIFGVYNRKLDLIALAHLAYPAAGSLVPGAAEFGGSVSAHARGRGYGARLFEHAMLHARNRGLDTLYIHALSENTAMLRIARKAGAHVERAGSETDAYLKLPHDTLASKVEQWVGESAAELDYRLKQQARMMDALIEAIGDVKATIGKSNSPTAKD